MSKLVLTLEEGFINFADVIEKLKAENPDHIMKETESYSNVHNRFHDDYSNSLHYFGLAVDPNVIDAVKVDIKSNIDRYPQYTGPIEYDEVKRRLRLVMRRPYASGSQVDGTWFEVENYYNISPQLGSQLVLK